MRAGGAAATDPASASATAGRTAEPSACVLARVGCGSAAAVPVARAGTAILGAGAGVAGASGAALVLAGMRGPGGWTTETLGIGPAAGPGARAAVRSGDTSAVAISGLADAAVTTTAGGASWALPGVVIASADGAGSGSGAVPGAVSGASFGGAVGLGAVMLAGAMLAWVMTAGAITGSAVFVARLPGFRPASAATGRAGFPAGTSTPAAAASFTAGATGKASATAGTRDWAVSAMIRRGAGNEPDSSGATPGDAGPDGRATPVLGTSAATPGGRPTPGVRVISGGDGIANPANVPSIGSARGVTGMTVAGMWLTALWFATAKAKVFGSPAIAMTAGLEPPAAVASERGVPAAGTPVAGTPVAGSDAARAGREVRGAIPAPQQGPGQH